MTLGVIKRKNRQQHVPIMYIVILWDILLILQIELTRGAVEKAAKVVTNTMILNIHVSLAVASVVFYVLLLVTGRKLLKGQRSVRGKHKLFGWTAYALRLLTLITSFFVVTAVN